MFVIQTKTNYNMKTITYTNNQGLELKINKFSSGQFKWAFSLTFNNGVHTFCYTMTELRTILLKNGMTRKWAANVKDRFDPLTEEHVLINRYRIPGGSEREVFITSRIPFVNMIGTGLDMVKLANELSGMDNTLTKREALLVCMGFTTGEAYVYGKHGINE
nr:MAG: hypothetical protein [Bacteriophage sp.]